MELDGAERRGGAGTEVVRADEGLAGLVQLRAVATVGLVLAALFRSLTSFAVRMIDPNEFTTIQAASYARFSRVDIMRLEWRRLFTRPLLLLLWKAAKSRLSILKASCPGYRVIRSPSTQRSRYCDHAV